MQVTKVAGGLILAVGGLAYMGYKAHRLLQLTQDQWKLVFELGEPAPLVEPSRYEEILNFNRFGKMPKRADVLFLSPLSYVTQPGTMPYSPYVTTLFRSVDQFAYKQITHPQHICDKIQALTSTNKKIFSLVINAHASSRTMEFTDTTMLQTFDPLPAGCFEGLSQRARIILIACEAGLRSGFRPSLAEWLSWISGRKVVASGCGVDDVHMKISYNESLQHLDMRFQDPNTTADCTVEYDVTGSWTARTGYLSRASLSGLRGVFTAWQMARLSATLLQVSGTAIQIGTRLSAPYVREVASSTGLYNPLLADICYFGSIATGKILSSAGETIHNSMNQVVSPINRRASTLVQRSAQKLASLCNWLPAKFKQKK